MLLGIARWGGDWCFHFESVVVFYFAEIEIGV